MTSKVVKLILMGIVCLLSVDSCSSFTIAAVDGLVHVRDCTNISLTRTCNRNKFNYCNSF